jgi:hypothetical protein
MRDPPAFEQTENPKMNQVFFGISTKVRAKNFQVGAATTAM